MRLERGKKYKHGANIMLYSHSDVLHHNHFFTVVENPKQWELDALNQVSIPTWDLNKNVSEVTTI